MDVCVHFHCATLCLWEMRLLRGMREESPEETERLSCSPREILWQYLQLTAFNRHWHLLSHFDIGTQQIAAEVRASVERNPKSSELGRDWEDFCQQEFLVFCCCCQAVSWLIGNDRSSLAAGEAGLDRPRLSAAHPVTLCSLLSIFLIEVTKHTRCISSSWRRVRPSPSSPALQDEVLSVGEPHMTGSDWLLTVVTYLKTL